MATIRELNGKIRSLGSMQKVMGAMKMISTIRLQKLFSRAEALKSFDPALRDMIGRTRTASEDIDHPLLTMNRAVKRTHIIVFTADKGLCGSHNNSVLKALDTLMAKNHTGAIGTELTCIGTKGAEYARREGYTIRFSSQINERVISRDSLRSLTADLVGQVVANEIQEIFVIYNRFISTIQQETITRKVIPFLADSDSNSGKLREKVGTTPHTGWMTFEPSGTAFIVKAASMFLEYTLHAALLHSHLSEHASRMTAMENATKNTEELIGRYSLVRNRARQATITGELIEIISGKEALKG